MKKIISILGICLLLLSATGCAEQKENNENQPQKQAPTQQPQPVVIGRAETVLLDRAENRLHNISLCIDAVNGCTLAPGESFSFNKRVGERSAKRGYRKAAVILHGEKVQDYGGGVCQVSSTLFQAVREAGLVVKERHNHQKDVGYAKPGDDAAVDYGTKDLRFQNSCEFPIEIRLMMQEGTVIAEVYRKI